MTVAIFGDSHAGRIKRTWDRTVKGCEEWTTTWFIHRSMGTEPMRFIDSNSGELIELTKLPMVEQYVFRNEVFTKVIVIGMGPSMQWAMELAEQFSHPDLGATSRRSLTALSWESALLDIFESSNASAVIRAVRRAAPSIPIVFAPQVRPMSWVNSRENHTKSWSTSVFETGSHAELERVYLRSLEAFCSRQGVQPLDQPAETIYDSCWTDPKFGFGKYLDENNQYWVRGDYFHNNDAYATEFISRLGATSGYESLPPAFVWPQE
ncbi:hypothetical protein IEE92_02340 [Kocuria sp. cx-116]|uniref:hypothetical protein n=1 Tax=Kocuria sp. cx-116 TaxID=2771378 RepID=UPI001685047A|nr:hypothetical protein [Kocuria sp. cx-116]MBD2761400.1 hypothetical protein [Kocuria sp. cx-116]